MKLKLSRRQRQILTLLANGLSGKQVAYELGIAEGTVKFYIYEAKKANPKITSTTQLACLTMLDTLFNNPEKLKEVELEYAEYRLRESPLHKLMRVTQSLELPDGPGHMNISPGNDLKNATT